MRPVIDSMRSYLLAGFTLTIINGLVLLLRPLEWHTATPPAILEADHLAYVYGVIFILVALLKLVAAITLIPKLQQAAVLSAIFVTSAWAFITAYAAIAFNGYSIAPFVWLYFALIAQAVLPLASLGRREMADYQRQRAMLYQRLREVGDTLHGPLDLQELRNVD